jgi:hypothetical protein
MDFEQRRAEAHSLYKASLQRVKEIPVPQGQKFSSGTRVKIADDLRPSMSHFPHGKNATVLYTYAHAYGGNDVESYCLDIDGEGETSWYYEDQLTAL